MVNKAVGNEGAIMEGQVGCWKDLGYWIDLENSWYRRPSGLKMHSFRGWCMC